MTTFQEFSENRRLLQEFCQLHYPSVAHFSSGLSFVNVWRDGTAKTKTKDVVHLTSSATCFSSLLECPDRFEFSGSRELLNSAEPFVTGAIEKPTGDWVSDGSAGIYCRCRALPFVTRTLKVWHDNIAAHTRAIFEQMTKKPYRFAIGEAGQALNEDDWYPPNGYHTYWTLELLCALREQFKDKYAELDKELSLPNLCAKMHAWARETLGYQVSLHSARSSMLDSDQLGWALTIVLRSPETVQSNLAEQDLTRQSLKCLFETQTEVGSWRHYEPLFHYEKSGNAHCYVFETFAELLRCALRPRAGFVRTALKTHFDGLIKLWQYARSTLVPLDDSLKPKAVGWSSGHRTGKRDPESWATASVFLYAQHLRQLVGIWAREEALSALPKRISYSTPEEAAAELTTRTQTWTSESDLKAELVSMFVSHIATLSPDTPIDPDNQPIGKTNNRSAILYGPPGTGKTTMAKALAGMIRWDYIELHASHFVADGLPNVQRTADEIFRRLMELDHAVVLFDEIDELVREREGEVDAFGRFLTTSMLPKLAELWKNRKLMYFVATNHISYFDRAITRSGRFDAQIFVSPPSFSSKVAELKRLLVPLGKTVEFTVSKEDIERAMPHPKSKMQGKDLAEKELSKKNVLAKFALLRWDELENVASSLASDLTLTKSVDKGRLGTALERVRRTQRDFFDFERDKNYERRASVKYAPRRSKA
jgi:energy-coupling factor transporter ATP-binding protein EcfA2